MLTILIDLQACQTESRFRGLGRYTAALAHAMLSREQKHDVHLLLNSAFPATILAIRQAFEPLVHPGNIHVVELLDRCDDRTAAHRWRKNASTLLREAYIEMLSPDVVFCPSFFEGYIDDAVLSVNRLSRIPVVVTLHDLIPLVYEADYLTINPDFERHYRSKLEELKTSAGLLTISDVSLAEAIDLLGFTADKVINASEAADGKFRRLDLTPSAANALRAKFGLERPFIFYTGGSDLRKNLERLVIAFAKLPPALRARYQLVLGGSMLDVHQAALEEVARKQGLDRRALTFLGYVSDDDLIELYNLAELFVFPSLHEGFGLPCLEAFQCGTPVIGANISSLPEVIGTPEALFDPFSADDIAAKIEAVLTDPSLRQRLIDKGAVHASRFSWENTADMALAGLARFAGPPSARSPSWASISEHLDRCDTGLIDAVSRLSTQASIPSDADLMQFSQAMARNRSAVEKRLRVTALPADIQWRLEGPFDSSYSLALVNRKLAQALAGQGHRVSLLSSEGGGEFAPSADFLANYPEFDHLYQRALAQPAVAADVVSRNMYPPRVIDMPARINGLHNYAWEETGFPFDYAEALNESLQFITVTSRHVKRLLIDSGVSVPISVVGNGVDHWLDIMPDAGQNLDTAGHTFLHVSSCFPRKGADVLLDSYGRAFSASDDVLLIIKTFRNPHNRIEEQLAAMRAGNPAYPKVLVLMDDMSDAQLKALYLQCDVLVAPSRAEGFGLPIAEAMMSGMRIITTGWSGQMDFCTPANSDLIDFTFARAATHEDSNSTSVWAEPDADHLSRLMRQTFERKMPHQPFAVANSALAAYSWNAVAQRNATAAAFAAGAPVPAEPRIGWISTFNKRCGIATYSKHLLDVLGMPTVILAGDTDQPLGADPEHVVRCWGEGKPDDLTRLRAAVAQFDLDLIVLQFNYGFYDFDQLPAFIDWLADQGKRIVVFMHATIDPVHDPERQLQKLVPALRRSDRILVHSVNDMNRLKSQGLIDNVGLFPHGLLIPAAAAGPRRALRQGAPIRIASYGFFLPNKGLLELIQALHVLRGQGQDYRLSLINAEFPAAVSQHLIQEARALIAKLRLSPYVQMRTEFLSDEDSLALLSSADLIVYPYQATAESASGAVRYGLASGRPVAVTPLSIFDDVADSVFTLPGTSPEDIADGLRNLAQSLADDDHASRARLERARRWRDAHGYPLLGRRLAGMLRGIFGDRGPVDGASL